MNETEGHPLIPDYELNGDGSIDSNPLQVAENDLAELPTNQAEVDAKKPRIDARTLEPENQDLSQL